MTIQEILNHESSFRYMMLDRMKQDCLYYLHNGRNDKYLWSHDPNKQVEYMKAIWNSFPIYAKPQWLAFDEIIRLENDMMK